MTSALSSLLAEVKAAQSEGARVIMLLLAPVIVFGIEVYCITVGHMFTSHLVVILCVSP